jgi:cyclic beta-1,2-glucan synthetase
MATLAARRNDHARAERYHRVVTELSQAIDRAWDGAWYRRAYFDDGTPLGSSGNDECRIDSIAQSWAVLSSAADPLRRQIAMDAVDRLLVDRRNGLVGLLAPAFEHMVPRAGYIQAYPPGVRENGGQYTHAAAWVIAAFARLGESGTALELLRMVNPVLRTSTPEGVARYQLEPYFVAGDVYADPHAGRGGWSAYTGSSGWIYRVAVEEILGLRFQGEAVTVSPRIPKEWRGFTVRLQRPDGALIIEVENRPGNASLRAPSVEIDGTPVADGRLPLNLRGEHRARVVLEQIASASRHESQTT